MVAFSHVCRIRLYIRPLGRALRNPKDDRAERAYHHYYASDGVESSQVDRSLMTNGRHRDTQDPLEADSKLSS